MNREITANKAAQRYDAALLESRRRRKPPPGVVEPQTTDSWPAENVELLARYWRWLEEENSTPNCIEQIYIPMAGHVLGLNLKPHSQLDLNQDLERALDYIKARGLSPSWTQTCRWALGRFRRFLRYERNLVDVSFDPEQVSLERYQEGLPAWLIKQLTHYQHIRQLNWRPARLPDAIRRFWGSHSRLWQWLFAQEGIVELTDIKRRHLYAYIDERLAAGYAAKSVNQDLRAFQATLRFLQERAFHIPLAILKVPLLKEPDALPRFLTDEEVGRLQADIEQRVVEAQSPAQFRNAVLDRAVFYLLWHGGLRLGEVEELCLPDLSFSWRQLIVRQGKGMKDRTIYLTNVAVAALGDYLKERGAGHSDHVFLYRHKPLNKGLIHSRIKAAGERTGVKVTAHRLRHTCATQLVNAGCPITTIQSVLGHRQLSATLVYARVHDRTVAEDYYAAMAVIEERLAAHLNQKPERQSHTNGHHPGINGNAVKLLRLVSALQVTSLTDEQRAVVTELQQALLSLAD